jgi:putative FmdB family regulatory protein
MPIYEYQCEACGHRLEKLQKIADDPLKDCPACNKPELKKLVSAAAFRLKGGGWYETDFKTGSKKNVLHGADSSSKSSNDGESGSAPKSSDSKSSSTSNKSAD